MPLLYLILLALLLPFSAEGKTIPPEAYQYQRDLIRQVRYVWGMDGPVALHAAQIHQESFWQNTVNSPMGAQGMAQFMPDTAAWIGTRYPELGEVTPYSPSWAIGAMVRFNRYIYDRLKPIHTDEIPRCDRLAMMLSGYNGGPGWINRDRRLAETHGADPDCWWGEVELWTNRADWAKRENRLYPHRIIFELEPRYLYAGWPGVPSCP